MVIHLPKENMGRGKGIALGNVGSGIRNLDDSASKDPVKGVRYPGGLWG